jgi:hypothetical protein
LDFRLENKPSGNPGFVCYLLVFGRLLLQKLLQMLDVIVPEVLDLAPRRVQAFLDGEVDALVSVRGCRTQL